MLKARGVEVALVVTHRDHPGEALWFERVADTAAELGVPFVYDDDPGWVAEVERIRPDTMFSFYFRSMLPMSVLGLAPRGAFNMHGSLLPLFRGRAPTNWAVLHGASETGATLHEMVAKADAGRIVDRQSVPILPDDTARQVFDKVTVAAEQVLWRSLPSLMSGEIQWRANDLAAGSYFGGRKPEDGRIDWSAPAGSVYNLIRAVAPPYPGAFTDVGGVRLVVAKARPMTSPSADTTRFAPGLHVVDAAIVGVCGDGQSIAVHELLADGRSIGPDTLAALLAGHDHHRMP